MSYQKVLQALETLDNGNLTDAKRMVKKISQQKMIQHIGRSYTMEYAILVTAYLKGKITFENYCLMSRKGGLT
jgi:hypothetical protein